MSDIVVTDAADQDRYEVHVDGALAGFAQYRRQGRVVTVVHTEVDPAYEGRGIGGALARSSLDMLRAAGDRVVPLCPFYAAWIGRHADYADLVDSAG